MDPNNTNPQDPNSPQVPTTSSAPVSPPEPMPTWPPSEPVVPVSTPEPTPAVPTWPPNPPVTPPPILPGLNQEPAAPTPAPAETAPTDLSHLAGSATENPITPTESTTQPETLNVPSVNGTENNQIVTGGGGHGFPKWLMIILGLLMLLGAGGASVYFILGIGQQPNTSNETATEQPSSVVPTQVLPPTVAPVPTIPSSSPSALELLRQRQSPTP